MESIYSTPFSKAILTAVFTGIITTVICLVYDVIFRESTHFALSAIINAASLIFFTNFLYLLIGPIYYAFLRIKKGEIIYIALFVSLTILFALMANNVHRSDVPVLNTQFHHLLVALVIIMGLAASIGIPVLYHSKKFVDNVL